MVLSVIIGSFTLKSNLDSLKEDEELVLVDYNSPDDTMIFVLATKTFKKYRKSMANVGSPKRTE